MFGLQTLISLVIDSCHLSIPGHYFGWEAWYRGTKQEQSTHGRSAQYAYINIDYIFQASITHSTVRWSTIAIICRFKASEVTLRMEFLWPLWYVFILVRIWVLPIVSPSSPSPLLSDHSLQSSHRSVSFLGVVHQPARGMGRGPASRWRTYYLDGGRTYYLVIYGFCVEAAGTSHSSPMSVFRSKTDSSSALKN